MRRNNEQKKLENCKSQLNISSRITTTPDDKYIKIEPHSDIRRENWRRGAGSNDINKRKKLRLPRELEELGIMREGSRGRIIEEARVNVTHKGIDRHTP